MKDQKITKVVITGGPCGGKTAALERIRAAYDKEDCRVILVGETATELILSGVTPWGTPNFQALRVARQLEAEAEACRSAEAGTGPVLLVFDRGIPDTRAYTSEEAYAAILQQNGLTAAQVMERYDAVIHLTSAAKGAPEAYTLLTNAARTEPVQEAAELDDRIRAAWAGHPARVMIPARQDFEEKMKLLLSAVKQIINTR